MATTRFTLFVAFFIVARCAFAAPAANENAQFFGEPGFGGAQNELKYGATGQQQQQQQQPKNRAEQLESEYATAYSDYVNSFDRLYIPNYGIHARGYSGYYGGGGGGGQQQQQQPIGQFQPQQFAYAAPQPPQQPAAVAGYQQQYDYQQPTNYAIPQQQYASYPQQPQQQQQPYTFATLQPSTLVAPSRAFYAAPDAAVGVNVVQQQQQQQPPAAQGVNTGVLPTSTIECPPGYTQVWCVPQQG